MVGAAARRNTEMFPARTTPYICRAQRDWWGATSYVLPMHAKRRQRLLDSLGPGLLILPTASHQLRNGDVHYDFRPGSDFHYLTGFGEPDALLCAWRTGRGSHETALFVPPKDKTREIWDGPRLGVKAAVRTLGVDRAYPSDELWKHLPGLVEGHDTVFHTLGRDPAFDQRLMRVFGRLAEAGRRRNVPAHPSITDPQPQLARLRQIKDRAEIASMAAAAEVSIAGHMAAMAAARPGMGEHEVQAVMEAEFRARGSRRTGYESIVASGPNACVLHYIQNDRKMRRGELLLIDAGAEVDGYTADITRTFPVSGSFSAPQRAIYEAVLRAEKAGIRAVKPGAAWNAPHKACVRVLTREMCKLGLLSGEPKQLIEEGAVRRWFMHGTSHWLGRDVHDVGAYEQADGKPIRFAPGMVLTVEPGLYFDKRDTSVPAEYRGIGVRIEDDVLVTARSNRVLTAAMPKEPAQVEALCAAPVPG